MSVSKHTQRCLTGSDYVILAIFSDNRRDRPKNNSDLKYPEVSSPRFNQQLKVLRGRLQNDKEILRLVWVFFWGHVFQRINEIRRSPFDSGEIFGLDWASEYTLPKSTRHSANMSQQLLNISVISWARGIIHVYSRMIKLSACNC